MTWTDCIGILKMLRLTLYEIVKEQKICGDGRGRTGGLLLAKQALYQLSYIPGLITNIGGSSYCQ